VFLDIPSGRQNTDEAGGARPRQLTLEFARNTACAADRFEADALSAFAVA
jgi:hypothetical protein